VTHGHGDYAALLSWQDYDYKIDWGFPIGSHSKRAFVSYGSNPRTWSYPPYPDFDDVGWQEFYTRVYDPETRNAKEFKSWTAKEDDL
jgi:hypothetical protein